jgi:outer membrane protein OmpA-like peptidoglycan-associated protein
MLKTLVYRATLAMGLMTIALPVHAQGWLSKIKDSAKERAQAKMEERVQDGTDSAVTKAMNGTQEVIVCLVTDRSCIGKAKNDGKQVRITGADGRAVSSADSARAIGLPTGPTTEEATAPAAVVLPGEGAWANYDFVPGDRVIFAEDFSADRVGNFPKRLQFKAGNMEIVEWQGARWLSDDGLGVFSITLPEVLPQRFTMEFELAGSGNAMSINFANADPTKGSRVAISTDQAWLRGDSVKAQGMLQATTSKVPVTIRLSVDGAYLKVYANEHRALNVPNANLGRTKHIYIDMDGWSAKEPRMIGNIRIAAGGRELYDAIAEKGRVSTHGILFATGSATIEGESTPTLKEIGDMLAAHPALKLTIEGHTDNVGAATANQSLSEQRAAAVKQYLVSTYAVDAARLETKGFGASKPAVSNDTPEGRQNNRRVDLVKM